MNHKDFTSKWQLHSFLLVQNARAIQESNRLLITFDLVGYAAAYGNSWRVLMHGSNLSGDKIQVAGRVIDNWDGTYTVYIQLPAPGSYVMDIILEYIACQGYPRGITSVDQFDYVGSYARFGLMWHPMAHLSSTPPQSPVLSYLADTGYYRNEVWIASRALRACRPLIPLPIGVNVITLAGDSTMRQLYHCIISSSCDKFIHKYYSLSNTTSNRSRSLNVSTFIQQFYFSDMDTAPILKHMSTIAEPQILLINAGLHLTTEYSWEEQKSKLDEIGATLGNSRTFVVWRDVWTIHEYCFVTNSYYLETMLHHEVKVISALWKSFLEMFT